jgi:PAS domain S-box-containing protein
LADIWKSPLTSRPPPDDRALHYLIDAVTDHAIYMLDTEGRVASWNTGAERLKGYTREEIEGEHFSRFFPLDARRKGLPERLIEQARTTGRVESEGWRVRKDGSRFWCVAALHAIKDEDGKLIGFAKITRDMTAEREAQQAIIDSERRFRLLVEGVVDYAIYMLDTNGVITNWNRGAERMKGYASSDIIGRHFSIFYSPQDRQLGLPARALATALAEGRFEAEGWRVCKDGSRFWASVIIDPVYEEGGELIGFAKITRDISERKAAEDALADSERQFRMLVSGVVDYSLFMVDPNGIVASWNAGAEKIKGYQAEEILGQHISRFYTEADRAAGAPMKALHAAATKGRFETEAWRVRKDGTLFWANVVLDAIHDETGALVGFAKITRDITDKRAAQQQLQRAHDQLAQAQKMEAIGQLTGGVAHDFNNLLMVVSGQAEILRTRIGEDARALRALDAIAASAKRGEELTRHLLSFARRQRLDSMPLALSDQFAKLRELLAASLPPSIQLVVDASPELWTITADASELELALLNMVVNARDAMPDGGTITIAAENVTLAEGEIEEDLSGEFVALTVADSGQGIPPDILPRIFDPFFTTKDVDKGTGLGLSQVYGFAQQSGGRIVAASELGRGTTFTLYLPRSAGEPVAALPIDGVEPVTGVSILVVEDNPEVADTAVGLLEELGHRVTLATSAQAALKALAAMQDRPDLVFTDVVMAGALDGLGLARKLRADYPGLPVLLATGYSQALQGVGAEFPVLRKPYRLPDLSRAVSSIVSRSSPSNLVQIDSARRRRTCGNDD